MNVSDSGSGKTGSLACLVDAGFNLRILDFDNGAKVLRGYVKDKSKLANVHKVDDLQDDMQLVAGRVGIKKAAAFQRAMDALDKGGKDYWGESGAHIGPLKTWTRKDILLLDSLTFAGRSSLLMVMQANAAAMKAPEIQHYGTAMENIERLLGQITGGGMPCHCIVNTHLTMTNGSSRPLPSALGDKLPGKVGRYFNTVVSLSVTGGQRTFKTKVDGLFACKTEVPLPETLPIDTGWKTIFEALTDKKLEDLLA